ncbi:substrate-binding domain-containing protein [Nocardioides cavernaquae]|uniref:Sugar ABC transporter substrate-binding protein n=1 Tax=Nocardioides cavernaquae TaxID=2321396 RepID=A0A3A5H940_9ACTN|nr:substrate-binding domain-containing protein [Nocardioides cavernaquae]RJS45895.1 sugar ABC transporter substrate-binding protein [Nocardioides cavernaquae]
MSAPVRRVITLGVAAVIGAAGLSACAANDAQEGGDKDAKTIALLLPESKTTRYEAFDKPLFEKKVAELCSDCNVDYYNADQDEAKQAQQVDSAVSKGADVIVLDPVNGAGAGGMVQTAQDAGATVVAYDRFIDKADYYLSFDNETVGRMQGEALVKAMGDKGGLLMLNGSPSDPNAAQFKAGAHSALDKAGVKILAEYDNPDWSPDNAQKWTGDQLAKYDASEIKGVYAANDGQAGGVVAALTGAGVAEDALPPITGQDAELAAIQRIVAGQQEMTIYKPIKIEADKAAELAVALVNGETPSDTTDFRGVASYIFDPIVVTQDNVAETVVKDGFYSVEDICTDEYAAACEAAGIS